MRGKSNWRPHLCPLPSRKRKEKTTRGDFDAGVAGQTALSGSQIKPPALPEVHDYLDAS
jgi:hypothetical protein